MLTEMGRVEPRKDPRMVCNAWWYRWKDNRAEGTRFRSQYQRTDQWRPFRRPGDRVGDVVGRAVPILEYRSARPHTPRQSETGLVETPRL